MCKPSPRSLVLYISGSGSTVCVEHRSSTSCPERSWLGNPLHTPSPEAHHETSHVSVLEFEKDDSQEDRNTIDFLTPVWLGSPLLWSTYQSPSHSQLREGSWKPWRGCGVMPVTSLHGQRSVGSRVSVKLSTGFHLWEQARGAARQRR